MTLPEEPRQAAAARGSSAPQASPSRLSWLASIAGGLLIGGSLVSLVFSLVVAWTWWKATRQHPPANAQALVRDALLPAARLAASAFGFWLGVLLIRLPGRRTKQASAASAAAVPTAPQASRSTRPAGTVRWALCNVFRDGADAGQIWQFNAHSFALDREHSAPASEPLPAALAGKSWSTLWQPKMNVAWLPPENVFIRVAQFPRTSPDETLAMVELQLEKLSPIPVTQAVWTLRVLPQPAGSEAGAMQTVAVTIAARSEVEEFLGRLEGRGYLADRLEVPVLDQLQAAVIREDGAWIYPIPGTLHTAFVAWWYGGVLQNLDLLTSPPGADRAAGMRDQLMQMAWAGEMDGWLKSPPAWHLVADPGTAADWEPPLRSGLDQPIELVAPPTATELAALTARRAVEADPRINLMPPEYAARYQQRFVDRLWLRGLGAVLTLYAVGCVVYFIAVAVLGYQTRRVEGQLADISLTYTNAIQVKARYAVLKERQELKFAALDCWEAAAELMPEGLTLDSLSFSDGKRMTISGTGPGSQVASLIDFSGRLRKYIKDGQPLFDANRGDPLHTTGSANGGLVSWNFGLELKRVEEQ
jgi:hypothetical protein